MSALAKKFTYGLAVLSISLLSSAVIADCGEVPSEPEIPKGSSSSMDELVNASQAVKAYIASADAYLDCREAGMATEEFLAQDDKVVKAARAEVSNLTNARNGIGDKFNKEVGAFKKANPR